MICNVKIKNCSEILLRREFTVTKGNFERKFKWFSIEDFLNDNQISQKNADLIKGLHILYETSMINVPLSFKQKITSANKQFGKRAG
jgi:hypothetical protein